jgi:hypothetical protein
VGAADIEWLVTDQLGTPRMIFDKTGSLANTKRHDYLPFGEELFATQGLRTGTMGYSVNDSVRQKFTRTSTRIRSHTHVSGKTKQQRDTLHGIKYRNGV